MKNAIPLRKLNTEKDSFLSFDGGYQSQVEVAKPDRYRYWTSKNFESPAISRGAGLSLAAASFGEGVLSVSHDNFDRVIGFDSTDGVVEVESGIRLLTLFNFLAPKGFFLPIQPGHGQITVGGCVAADVHGKNHRKEGTFINQVVSLKLFHPEHGILELSDESNRMLFRLTCGGFGLTGHILSVKLRVQRLVSFQVVSRAKMFDSLETGLSLLISRANSVDFIHSWHDFSPSGSQFGAGMVFESKFLDVADRKDGNNFEMAEYPKELTALRRFPGSRFLLNSLSMSALNATYRSIHKYGHSTNQVQIADAIFPIHRLQAYYYFLGNSGFHEYQLILPADGAADFLQQLGAAAKHFGVVITLASAKSFAGEQDLLRFSGTGICFAVNFVRNAHSEKLLDWLDTNVSGYGGRPNIIKDSRLPRHVVESCYPDVEIFRTELRKFDSKRLFKSELSERLGL